MDQSPPGDNVYCSNCGERNTRRANYCYYCGEQLREPRGGDHAGAPGHGDPGRTSGDHGHATGGQDGRVEDGRDDRWGDPASGPERGERDRANGGVDAQEGGRQPAASGAPEKRRPGETGPGRREPTGGGDVAGSEAIRSESPLRTVGVALGLGAGGLLSALVVVGIVTQIVLLVDPPLVEVFALLLVVMQFAWFAGFGIWYLRRRGFDRAQIRAYLGVERPSLKDIGLVLVTWFVMAIVAGVVATLVVELASELFGSAAQEGPAENPVEDVIRNNPVILPAAILFMFLVVGPSEEILFRGIVQGRLRERLSAAPAIVIASAIFASAHVVALIGQAPVAIAMTITILFVPSLGFGIIYESTGNIVVPALLHGFHNSVIVTLIYISTVSDIDTEGAMLVPQALGALPI